MKQDPEKADHSHAISVGAQWCIHRPCPVLAGSTGEEETGQEEGQTGEEGLPHG
jgi:hypothetical protein